MRRGDRGLSEHGRNSAPRAGGRNTRAGPISRPCRGPGARRHDLQGSSKERDFPEQAVAPRRWWSSETSERGWTREHLWLSGSNRPRRHSFEIAQRYNPADGWIIPVCAGRPITSSSAPRLPAAPRRPWTCVRGVSRRLARGERRRQWRAATPRATRSPAPTFPSRRLDPESFYIGPSQLVVSLSRRTILIAQRPAYKFQGNCAEERGCQM